MISTTSSSEAVRVVCRCRPIRSELIRNNAERISSSISTSTAVSVTALTSSTSNHVTKRLSVSSAKQVDKRLSVSNGGNNNNNPPNSKTANSSSISCITFPDNKSLTLQNEFTISPNSATTSAEKIKSKPYNFTFDEVFPPESTQEQVFEGVARETVSDVLKGYNGTIFAYGQTGSGKTHTMFGPSSSGMSGRGIVPRVAEALFKGVEESDEIEEVTIRCSFLEIYMESIRDLLHPAQTNLRIREKVNGDIYVQNLSDEYVGSSYDILTLINYGEKNRTVASTDMNEVSSRSHSVLILVIEQKCKNGHVRIGKLNLADLAGSERVERTNASGETLEEAKKINQSLSALGNCINALTDSRRTHIPFRDSTLTFLLKDSLGGNTKTTLLVCISGELDDLNETLSTLNFAKRAKKIKNKVTVNTQLGVRELQAMVDALLVQLASSNKKVLTLQQTLRALYNKQPVPDEIVNQLLSNDSDESVNINLPSIYESLAQFNGKSSPVSSPLAASTSSDIHQIIIPDFREDISVPKENHCEYNSLQQSSSNSPVSTPTSASFCLPDQSILDLETNNVLAVLPLNNSSLESNSTDTLPLSLVTSPTASMDSLQVIHEATSDVDLSRSSSAATSIAEPEKLAEALATIDSLKKNLSEERAHYLKKDKQWRLENARLRVDKEMLRVSARAGDALISNLTSVVKSRQKSTEGKSDENSAFLNDLLGKNERLERQMSEMKEMWTAYLELISESQKMVKKESRRISSEIKPESLESPSKAKIVKPVRKVPGTLLSLLSTPTSAAKLADSSPLANSQTLTSPSSSISTQPSTPSSMISPTSAESSTRITKSISFSRSTTINRNTLDYVLKRGHLYKKPVGMSLSLARAWRKRLVLLRPNCLDFYDIQLSQSSQGIARRDSRGLSTATTGSPITGSPPLSPATDLSINSVSELMGALRGTIPLDPQTTVQVCSTNDAEFTFEVITRGKAAQLHAESESERTEWIDAIQNVITALQQNVEGG